MSTTMPQNDPGLPRLFGITMSKLRKMPTDVSVEFTPGLRLMLTGVRSAAHGVMVDRLWYFTEPGSASNHLLLGAVPIQALQSLPPCGPCGKIVATVHREPCPLRPRLVLRRRRGHPCHAAVRETRPPQWQPRRRRFGLVLIGYCVWRDRKEPEHAAARNETEDKAHGS